MVPKPAGGVFNHRVKGSGLGKEMCRSGNDLQFLWRSQPCRGLLIQLDDAVVGATDDQQSRRSHAIERIAGKIRPAAAGDDRANAIPESRCRNECARCSCACPEETERQPNKISLVISPLDRVDQAIREQRDVEDVAPVALLGRREEVEQQRRDSVRSKRFGDSVVARALAAGAAPMHENDKARRPRRQTQCAGEPERRDDDLFACVWCRSHLPLAASLKGSALPVGGDRLPGASQGGPLHLASGLGQTKSIRIDRHQSGLPKSGDGRRKRIDFIGSNSALSVVR